MQATTRAHRVSLLIFTTSHSTLELWRHRNDYTFQRWYHRETACAALSPSCLPTRNSYSLSLCTVKHGESLCASSNNISSQWCPQDAKATGSALLCTFVYLNWKQPRHIWEEGISAEELPSLDWPAGKSGEAFPWLMIDWGGGQLITGSATPGFYKKGRWASHRKQANKQHSSWSLLQCLPSVSCLGFPSSWTVNLKLNKPSPLQFDFI